MAVSNCKKGIQCIPFSKFFENTNQSRDWEFRVCHGETGIFFLTTMFSRRLVPNSAWEGRSSAVPFFCHYFGFELTNASLGTFAVILNPLIPKNDQHQISHFSITLASHFKEMRI